jgi:hypothetical protein
MKILNAIHAQGIGGVDQVFRNYSEILLQQNHEVALLISDNVHDKYATKRIFKLKNSSQIFDCIKLLWILIKFKPDMVLCHSNRLMKWMKIMRFFSNTKSVAINHGISFKNSLNFVDLLRLQLLYRKAVRRQWTRRLVSHFYFIFY